MDKVKTSVSLTRSNYERLNRIAEVSGVTRSEVANRAIEQMVELIDGPSSPDANPWTNMFRAQTKRATPKSDPPS